MKKIIIILSVITFVFISLILIFGKTTIGKIGDTKSFKKSDFFNEYYNSNKLLLVNVWSTTCKPCIAEFPDLERFKSDKNFNFVSISIDKDSVKLKKYLEKNEVVKRRDITLKNFNVRDSIFSKIQLSGSKANFGIIKFNSTIIPYTVLIKNKAVIYKANDDIDFEKLKRLIDENK